MKRVLVLLFLLQLALALELHPKELSSATLRIDFTGEGLVDGSFQKINLTMYNLPISDDRQTARCDTSRPANYLFQDGDDLSYSYSCVVETEQIGTPIDDSSLPLAGDLPDEFLEQTELTELSPTLEEKAEELASSSLRETAYAINSWVYETIEYDTDYAFSIFAGAEQEKRTPQDTYSRRLGICGDKAHLAIGMMRHLGIPARYVAGTSYGRLQEEKFESHAWLETWFPESGWVPFDPTYGEYGYVDPTHVKYYHSLDSTFPVWQTKYAYYDEQPSITWERDETVDFLATERADNFGLEAESVERIEYDKHVLVTAIVENKLPIPAIPEAALYYEASNLEENFQLVWGEQKQLVELEAGQEGKVRWVLKAPHLEENKYYLIPMTVALEGERAEVSLELYPREGDVPLVNLITEASTYEEGDEVKMAVEVSPPGPETVVLLPSGREIEFSAGEVRRDSTADAHENLAAWSYSGGFDRAGIGVERGALEAEIEGPSSVGEGQPFELVVSVSGARGKSVRLDFDGESSVSMMPAEFHVRKSLSEDKTLTFTLTSGERLQVLSKRITVVPRPEISHRLIVDERLVKGVESRMGASGNGEVLLETPYGEERGNRTVVLEFVPTRCGTNQATVTVTAWDELGNAFQQSFQEEFEVACGLDAWLARIALFIEGLFG